MPDSVSASARQTGTHHRTPGPGNPNEKSYTSQLLAGGVAKIGAKIIEEAAEVVEAAGEPGEAGREHFDPRSGRPGVSPAGAAAARELLAGRRRGRTCPPLRRLWFGRKSGTKTRSRQRRTSEAEPSRPESSRPDPLHDHNLRIGIPSKGRLAEMAARAAERSRPEVSAARSGACSPACRDMPIDVTFLRTDDIPVLCAEGAIDLGITGGDLVDESGRRAGRRGSQLGMGNCRLAICVPEDSDIRKPRRPGRPPHRHQFPAASRSDISRGTRSPAHIVELTGSVEVMIALGVADAIVDLVETGSTLAANRLQHSRRDRPLRNRARAEPGHEARSTLADRVVRRLEGVVIARSYSLLEYNVPAGEAGRRRKRSRPASSRPRSASWKKPAGSASARWSSGSEVIEIMERLEALGALGDSGNADHELPAVTGRE